MASATQCPGLMRRPEPMKSSVVELLDVLPHAGDAYGRDNDDGQRSLWDLTSSIWSKEEGE